MARAERKAGEKKDDVYLGTVRIAHKVRRVVPLVPWRGGGAA